MMAAMPSQGHTYCMRFCGLGSFAMCRDTPTKKLQPSLISPARLGLSALCPLIKKSRPMRPGPCLASKPDYFFSVQVVVASSHCMPAFSQLALSLGASPANVGAAKETARPNAISIVTRFFMDVLSRLKFAGNRPSRSLRNDYDSGGAWPRLIYFLFGAQSRHSERLRVSPRRMWAVLAE